jgi:hypothetical protein
MMKVAFTLAISLCVGGAEAFLPVAGSARDFRVKMWLTTTTDIALDPKEAVKLFGRLAEKYIMLDDTGGMCCYSACKGE